VKEGIPIKLVLSLALAAVVTFLFAVPPPSAVWSESQAAVSQELGSWGRIQAFGEPSGDYLIKDAVSSVSTQFGKQGQILPVIIFLSVSAIFFIATRRVEVTHHHAAPLFACLLIILIPLYGAQAQAATAVQGVSISGKDGFIIDMTKGFRRQTDTVTVKVDVQLDGDSQINNTQVTFSLDSTGVEKQGTCSGTSCEFKDLELTYTGDHHYLVRLYNDTGTLFAQQFMEIYSDTQAPKFTLSKNASVIGAGGQIAVDWKVKDGRDAKSQCGVGINEMKIYQQDFSGAVLETLSGSGECELNGTYIIESSGTGEGDYRICFEASDRFNKTETSLSNCVTYSEDNDPPQAVGIGVFTSDGSETLGYMGPSNKSFMVKINVTGNVDPSTVSFDLASFGLGKVTPSHTQKNDTFHTFSASGNADVSSSFSASVIINGTDEAGNAITPDTLSAGTIQWDETGPKVLSYQSSLGAIDNILQIGSGGNLTAIVQDNMLETEQIRLIFTPESGSSQTFTAENCSESGGSWTCLWDFSGLSLGEGLYNITADPTSTDLFGNLLSNESATAQAMADFTPPELVNYTVNVAHANESLYGEEIVKGDKLQFILYVNDSSQSVTAVTNFSEIITTMPDEVSAACEADGTTSDFVCTFEQTDKIDMAFPYSLEMNITDAMGNSLIGYFLLDIIPFENETDPDYWSLVGTPECSPEMIDREITTLSSQKMYCKFTFQPKGSGISLLSIAMADCVNSTDIDVADYIQGFTQINTDNSTEPWVKIQFKNVPMNITELPMTCPFQIYSKIQGEDDTFVVVENAEIENVSLTIPFYNNPLGTIDQNLEDKVTGAMEDAQGSLLEIVGILETVVDLAEKICGLWSAYQNLVGAYNLFMLTTEKAETAVSVNAPLAETLRKMKERGCVGSDDLSEAVKKKISPESLGNAAKESKKGFSMICGYVNCKYLPRDAEPTTGLDQLDNWQIKGTELLQSIDIGDGYTFGQPSDNASLHSSLNVKDNLILSLITGCLPGIIHGINKYRQTLCMYAYCMNTSAESGFDQSLCSDLKEYSMCMFVFGEIIYALPWTGVISRWLDTLSQVMSNPFAIIGVAWSYTCQTKCALPKIGGETYWACTSFYFLTMLSEAVAEIMGVFEAGELGSDVDWCELMEGDTEGGLLGF